MIKLNLHNKVITRISALSIALVSLGGCNAKNVVQDNSKLESSQESSIANNIGDFTTKKNVEVSNVINDSKYTTDINSYCWPIGSEEVTNYNNKHYSVSDSENVQIVSNFGYNSTIYDKSSTVIMGDYHRGIDIVSQNDVKNVNIIAANDGVVVYPTSKDRIDYIQNDRSNFGYGNYVVIQHNDGNYTLYGHLQDNTITVKAGDVVSQGQVIGKMGQSGNAVGTHLHFELREGSNTFSATVNPLNYIVGDTKVKIKK